MGSDESHLNVSLIVRDKGTRQCPQTTSFEDRGEPKQIRTEVPLLTSLTPYRWAKPALNPRESKETWCLTSTETIRLIRDGEKGGKGAWRWGEREIIYLSLQCHHQKDSCIKMGSDESRFNVSVGSDG